MTARRVTFRCEVRMMFAEGTMSTVDGPTRPLTDADIPALRSFLADTLPMSAHVAGVIESMDWRPGRIQQRVNGVFACDEIQAVVLMGQVVRTVSSTPDAYPAVEACIRDAVSIDTRALMGPEDVIAMARASFPLATERRFEVWQQRANPRPPERVRPPAEHEVPAFAEASFQAFREELGVAPGRSPADPAYRDMWDRARRQGRLLGAWDDNGHCVFRVEIRPALGLTAELRGLWLAPHMRGLGMGHALLDETVGYVAATFTPRVQVIADVTNPVAANLYRGAGFTPVGQLSRLDLPRVEG